MTRCSVSHNGRTVKLAHVRDGVVEITTWARCGSQHLGGPTVSLGRADLIALRRCLGELIQAIDDEK